MKPYVLGESVAHDLDCIWEYIAQDKVVAADRWITRLFDAFETISQSPAIGHKRKDLTQLPVLFWPVGEYLIVYRSRNNCVEIIAVTQGSRDIPVFLSQRLP